MQCQSLAEVRQEIDILDRQIVALIAERGQFVKQAARFKRSAREVLAPQRVAEVLARVDSHAEALGADRHVVSAVWRAMISTFIHAEKAEHAALHPPSPQPSE